MGRSRKKLQQGFWSEEVRKLTNMVGDKKTSEERMDDRHLQGFGDWFDSEIYLFTKFHIWITRTVIFHQWKFEEAGLVWRRR